ncbi:unnamed protein product [Durusdinium trenchii]|uniref:Uncharacterized protein n=1 Tax=Durusdinium trenchii TaxID=1381693 RepID=A0ABP0LNB1_9DINO
MRLSVEAAYGWPCTKLRHPLHPTVFKQGDVGIHLHVQYDPVKEMVLEAKTYTVPNLDDEPPPPSGEVLQKIEAMASEAMSENGACRQKMSQVNLALRDAPKLPQAFHNMCWRFSGSVNLWSSGRSRSRQSILPD